LDEARQQLLGGLACVLETLGDASCATLFGPPLPGMTMAGGARIPGTSLELDPTQAAFSLGLLLRWRAAVDSAPDVAPDIAPDAAPGRNRGHPHDSLGALLALFDYRARRALHAGQTPPTVRDLLLAHSAATQIQMRLELPAALDNLGLRVRIATALIAAMSLGATAPQLHGVFAEVLLDGRAPDAAQRRWLVADAGSRGLWHALVVMRRGANELATQRQSFALGAATVPAPTTPPPTPPTTASAPTPAMSTLERLHAAVAAHFSPRQAARIHEGLADPAQLDALRVSEFIARFVKNS
jgi:2-methylcitrate dehydratase PrpD